MKQYDRQKKWDKLFDNVQQRKNNAKINNNIMTTAPFSTPISPSEIPTNLCRQDTLLSTPKINEESDEYVYQVLSPGNKKFGPILYC